MNTKVIYTSLVGNYDNLLQPKVIDKSFDYICFSNDIMADSIGVWKILPIPFKSTDNTRLSRYAKILPHECLKKYEYSVWIDANIQIIKDEFYLLINRHIDEGHQIVQVPHIKPFIDCIYQDIRFALRCCKVDYKPAFCQYIHLRQEGFPEHYGLCENNLIIRKHNSNIVKRVSILWWSEFVRYAKRDQFSLFYAYWKCEIRPYYLDGKDICTRNASYLKYNDHINSATVKLPKKFSHLYMRIIDKFTLLLLLGLDFVYYKAKWKNIL